MTTERVPITDEVREAAVLWAAGRGRGTPSPDEKAKAYAEFDRWLAEHDREVAAQVWEAAGAEVMGESEILRDAATCRDITNRYRARAAEIRHPQCLPLPLKRKKKT